MLEIEKSPKDFGKIARKGMESSNNGKSLSDLVKENDISDPKSFGAEDLSDLYENGVYD